MPWAPIRYPQPYPVGFSISPRRRDRSAGSELRVHPLLNGESAENQLCADSSAKIVMGHDVPKRVSKLVPSSSALNLLLRLDYQLGTAALTAAPPFRRLSRRSGRSSALPY